MPRSVVAVDTTVFYASVARLVEGDPKPKCGYKFAYAIKENAHHPVTEMLKQEELAEQVVDAIIAGGVPELVVLVTQVPQGLKSTTKAVSKGQYQRVTTGDVTATRRIGVHWALVRRLHAKRIPVAEISMLTLGYVLNGRGAWGKEAYTALADRVHELWPEAQCPTRPMEDNPDKEIPDARYRMSTVGLAALGMIAAGIPITYGIDGDPLPVTKKLIQDIRRGSAFPPGFNVGDAPHRAVVAEHKASKRERDAKRATEFFEALAETESETARTLPLVEMEKFEPRTEDGKQALKRRRAQEEENRLTGGRPGETAAQREAREEEARITAGLETET